VDDLPRLVGEFPCGRTRIQLVGCACAELFGDTAIVRSVAVLREWRDQGVASHLVNAVMMRARANGSRRAVLLTSTCPSYFARYGFSLIHASKLPRRCSKARNSSGCAIPARCACARSWRDLSAGFCKSVNNRAPHICTSIEETPCRRPSAPSVFTNLVCRK
jgi:N-acetylglutamate synthase-like GNAT family acetyltransferase